MNKNKASKLLLYVNIIVVLGLAFLAVYNYLTSDFIKGMLMLVLCFMSIICMYLDNLTDTMIDVKKILKEVKHNDYTLQ